MNQSHFRFAVFLSGAAGLLLQTLWVRRLGFIFGNTTTSVSLVLGSFFLGMALGSRLLGRRIDASRSPLATYARLELAIGAAAATIWFALPALEPLYVWLYRVSGGSLAVTHAAQVVLTFVLLIVPTALMGATLPAMVRYVSRDRDAIARSIGSIYSTNALGAAVGLIGGSFFLIELLGLRGSYMFAIVLNLTAAVLSLAQERRAPWQPLEQPSIPGSSANPAGGLLYGLAFATGFLGIGFYRLAKARLKPGGVLIQRFSGEPDSEAFYPELLRSISDVFAEVTVWGFLRRGIEVIASDRPLRTFNTSKELIDGPIANVAPHTFLFGRAEVDAYVEHAMPVTDDRPSLEFNLLSRWRDKRFTSQREENLRSLYSLRRPISMYLAPDTSPRN